MSGKFKNWATMPSQGDRLDQDSLKAMHIAHDTAGPNWAPILAQAAPKPKYLEYLCTSIEQVVLRFYSVEENEMALSFHEQPGPFSPMIKN